MNCTCPHCGSPRTQALRVLHIAGVRRYDWDTSSLFYYRGAAGIRATTGRGRSRSLISELARPPVPWFTEALGDGGIAVVIVVVTLLAGWWGFGLAVGSLLVVAIAGGRTHGAAHARALEEWNASFHCARCGTIFRESPT